MTDRKPVGEGPRFGALAGSGGIRFSVWSETAERVWVSLFDAKGENETERLELAHEGGGVHALFVPGLSPGARYGFRADGPYAPQEGFWFDPDKLLVDPYAVEIDREYVFDRRLCARRGEGGDTAPLVPKSVALALPEPQPAKPPVFTPGGLIYELPVRAFTMRHSDVPVDQRGTIGALAHPAIIDHLTRLNVSAIELLPVTAWIDERHLPQLGLTNGWGYNPVSFMALDPRLAPGGLVELSRTVAALREAGIGVILDLVFNHTGESDEFGPTLSLRGLDNRAYYRHRSGQPGKLVNDTGTGNTLACAHSIVQELVLDSLRHFVSQAGVDGFRFDLATVLGRSAEGFSPHAPLFEAMRQDPVLKDRVMIAEPWDIGPDGYQLGNFPDNFLEWNDRYRDDIRRFWRGDRGMAGSLATRLAGSSDIFARPGRSDTRTVNFVAAHDGLTLADLSSYGHKHNQANGEGNRDGHGENLSWNNGVEGPTDDPDIVSQRQRDARALLATLFASRGTIMLTAGDEFGRTQQGNNNAYAQDNELTWLDWDNRDLALQDYVAALSTLRSTIPALSDTQWLTGTAFLETGLKDVEWLDEKGQPLTEAGWRDPERRVLVMMLGRNADRLAVVINGGRADTDIRLPIRAGYVWRCENPAGDAGSRSFRIPPGTVVFARESQADPL